MSKKEIRKIRGREIGFVFQDPMTSLNPTMRVGAQIEEVFIGRAGVSKKEVKEKALEIMKLVGISDVEKRYRQYPHELSGGQLQRVCIARAVACEPQLILFDEAISSLDAHTQVQVMDLLMELKDQLGLTYVFITHDLTSVTYLCDQVLFLYKGRSRNISRWRRLRRHLTHTQKNF